MEDQMQSTTYGNVEFPDLSLGDQVVFSHNGEFVWGTVTDRLADTYGVTTQYEACFYSNFTRTFFWATEVDHVGGFSRVDDAKAFLEFVQRQEDDE